MRKQKNSKYVSRKWVVPIGISLLVLFFAAALLYWLPGKNVDVLMPKGRIADQQADLMLLTFALGMIVIVPVFIMLGVFAWKYRATNITAKYEPDVEGNRLLESIWWGIPILIIGALSVVTWVSTHELDPYKSLDSDKPAIKVQVVALQWRWLFIYPEQGIASVNELRFPEKTPVDYEIAADAPMSAFWIPSLGSQIYAMNGMTSRLSLEANSTGTFKGRNTNINGEGYADMQFDAISMTPNDFDTWVMQTKQSNNHLDWNTYESLSEPSRNKSVDYFILDEEKLYQKVLDKYMSHGSSHNYEMKIDHSTMNHNGMGH